MAAMKPTPTKLVIKEYVNYTLMIGATSGALSVAYCGATGKWPEFGTVMVIGGVVAALPAMGLAAQSVSKMFDVSRPVTVRHEVSAGGGMAPIERQVNGVKTFFKTLPFDPRLAFDPGIKDEGGKPRTIRYKEPVYQPKWWAVEVMKRTDRPTIISVKLYEDLVMQIVEKGWRAQRTGKPHPISQRYLCSLHYEALEGQRLDDIYYLAFIKLGERYNLFGGARRQGTSGKLGGSPLWCRRQLGLST